MKKCLFLILLIGLWVVFVSAQKIRPTISKQQSKASSEKAQLLKEARLSWSKFMISFRNALKNRDDKLLDSLIAQKFAFSCTPNGESRADFFNKDSENHKVLLDAYLNILTPGGGKDRKYKLHPIKYDFAYDDESGVKKVYSREIGTVCWSLKFEFRKATKWELISDYEPCQGC